ncbi:MAG: carboxylesterase family protein [Clostridia bacterium]
MSKKMSVMKIKKTSAPKHNEERLTIDVQTHCGCFRGLIIGNTCVFRGIPYAVDYTGPFRFCAAKPAPPFNGVMEAYDFSLPLYQIPKNIGGIPEGSVMSENSLSINVFSPKKNLGAEKLPVMFFIYGGAFSTGDSGMDIYNGEFLSAHENVIVVTFNYRINAFGFLDFSSLDGKFDSNPGMKDQVMALKWTYENIAAFGGDPENITIFGQSAGGNSVTTLLAVPSARKYINKAIALSSYPFAVNTLKESREYALGFLEILGLGEGDIDKLCAMEPNKLSEAAKVLETRTWAKCENKFAHAPVIDGTFLPESPLYSAMHPLDKKVIPLILGTVRDEATIYANMPTPILASTKTTIEALFLNYGLETPDAVLEAYENHSKKLRYAHIGGDALFRLPCILYADAYSINNPTWFYRFEYYSTMLAMLKFYCMHGADVAFAFDHLDCSIGKVALLLTPFKGKVNDLAHRFSSWIAEFSRTGDAGFENYSKNNRNTKIWNKVDSFETDAFSRELAVWRKTGYFSYINTNKD